MAAFVRSVGLVAALVLGASAAGAGADVVKKCDDPDNYVRIEGCSAIIANHREPNRSLVPTWYNRALAYYRVGAFDRALADLELMLQFEKRDLRAYLIRGQIRYARKDYAGAVADYDAAVRIKPDLPVSRIERARANVALAKYPDAIGDLDKAIRLEPTNAGAYYLRGLAQKSLGKPGLAGADWQRALKSGGSDWLQWWRTHLGKAGLYSGKATGPADADLLAAILACANAPEC